jgi:predicted O-methyltransferase YrrM
MICYEFITNYIRGLTNRNQRFIDIESYASEHKIPIIQPEIADFLCFLGNLLKPKKILEIGTAIGYSTILMAGFLCDGGTIDTIEINEQKVEIAKKNIKNYGLEHAINIIIGDALDIVQCLHKKYDLIFIDGAKGQYSEYFKYCYKMLGVGGVLVSDNVLYKGMVANGELEIRRKKTLVRRLRSYLEEITNHEGLITSILPLGDGIAVSYKK